MQPPPAKINSASPATPSINATDEIAQRESYLADSRNVVAQARSAAVTEYDVAGTRTLT